MKRNTKNETTNNKTKPCYIRVSRYLIFWDVLIKNTKIGEVDLVLIDGKLRYFERNIRSGIEHEDYYHIKYISEKLKVNDIYKVIE